MLRSGRRQVLEGLQESLETGGPHMWPRVTTAYKGMCAGLVACAHPPGQGRASVAEQAQQPLGTSRGCWEGK